MTCAAVKHTLLTWYFLLFRTYPLLAATKASKVVCKEFIDKQYRIIDVARKRSSLNTTTKLPCSNHVLNTNKMSTSLKAIISMVSVGFCSVVSSLLKFMALAQKRSSTTSTTEGAGPAIKKSKGMTYYIHGSYIH